MRKSLFSKKELPSFEQQLILAHIIKKSREYVLSHPEIRLSKVQQKRYEELLKRRQDHEPLAHILGHKEFYSLDFKVTPDTLIPRPETELLVEEAVFLLRNMLRNNVSKSKNARDCSKKITVIDVGTGSGNVVISVARNTQNDIGKNIIFYGLDILTNALRVARHNAKKNNVAKKIMFIQSDLLEIFSQNNKYGISSANLIIIANLPYLSKKIYSETMPDVKYFEPKSALYSPREGLHHYNKLFQQIKLLQARNCKLKIILEFSPEQIDKLKKMTEELLPSAEISFKKDLSGRWRCAIIDL